MAMSTLKGRAYKPQDGLKAESRVLPEKITKSQDWRRALKQ